LAMQNKRRASKMQPISWWGRMKTARQAGWGSG
jgi:hypothetical protein